jgi:hypothetical protein
LLGLTRKKKMSKASEQIQRHKESFAKAQILFAAARQARYEERQAEEKAASDKEDAKRAAGPIGYTAHLPARPAGYVERPNHGFAYQVANLAK